MTQDNYQYDAHAAFQESVRAVNALHGIPPGRHRGPFAFPLAVFCEFRITRALFQKESTRPLPEDAEQLARLEQWVALWADDEESSAKQVAAASRYAKAAREISCIRSFREELVRSVPAAYLGPKTLRKLVALDRCERLAKAVQKRACKQLGDELDEHDYWAQHDF